MGHSALHTPMSLPSLSPVPQEIIVEAYDYLEKHRSAIVDSAETENKAISEIQHRYLGSFLFGKKSQVPYLTKEQLFRLVKEYEDSVSLRQTSVQSMVNTLLHLEDPVSLTNKLEWICQEIYRNGMTLATGEKIIGETVVFFFETPEGKREITFYEAFWLMLRTPEERIRFFRTNINTWAANTAAE